MEVDAEILAHYAEGREHARLTSGQSLELLRTRVLLERFLPDSPARVLDVGGGSGVYASWLSGRGYQVHLIDPVPLHRQQARADGRFTVAAGDARSLAEADGSYDAVLLLGPLYHLTDRADRIRALAEARRVTRPGGIVAAAAISRYASTFEGYFGGFIDEPGFTAVMAEDLKTGQHRNPGSHPRFFTTAFFHDPAGLMSEITDSGLRLQDVLPVEGPLHWAPGIQDRLSDPGQRQLILDTLDAMEHDPAVAGATSHLLAIGQRP
ncbi:MAG TPA: methyltransferase domain-containing protein [Streptosporangiaceae bacterium]|nr:methyltransferase domain-containing protein [Streptosporangiaceae bacterium]